MDIASVKSELSTFLLICERLLTKDLFPDLFKSYYIWHDVGVQTGLTGFRNYDATITSYSDQGFKSHSSYVQVSYTISEIQWIHTHRALMIRIRWVY